MQLITRMTIALGIALAGLELGFDTGALPEPATDASFYENGAPSPAKVELGRMLFFDKVLSGNRNISCATCHHPELASADGLALPLGEGPVGLGPDRRPGGTVADGIYERVPRNSPALFNLGAREYTTMFHDGRVELDTQGFYEGGFITPARWKLPSGLDNPLAAQAMFPVTSPTEMAGQRGENDVADARTRNNVSGPSGVWETLGSRLRAIPAYVELFRAAYPDEVRGPEDVDMVRAANAIAAFEAVAFRADESPFDDYLRGQGELTAAAMRGMELFYGKADCSSCHSGTFQTDHDFHAIAMPQVGPGKSDGWNSDYWSATGLKAFPEDFGRGRVTARDEDRYKFRTPSLRNVVHTGPWGHDGAYSSLEDVVRHHLDPVASLEAYRPPAELLVPLGAVLEIVARGARLERTWLEGERLEGFLLRDTWVQSHPGLREEISARNELAPQHLSDAEVEDLLAFLEALTDPSSLDRIDLVPATVPSGLPVSDRDERDLR